LTKLGKPVARRIVVAVDWLKGDHRPGGARPLVGYPELWWIRVGDHRVICATRDAELLVPALRIAHRRGVYRSR